MIGASIERCRFGEGSYEKCFSVHAAAAFVRSGGSDRRDASERILILQWSDIDWQGGAASVRPDNSSVRISLGFPPRCARGALEMRNSKASS
jgi:hypothetical protein